MPVISCLAYWLIGYAIAYGDGNSFMGLTFWAGVQIPRVRFSHWFFQFVFAATAATLVSGAAAERCNFVAYLVYSAVISGFIYPTVAHWAWAPTGWLLTLGYSDFAGSGPVHMLGGVCSAVAAYFLGPRIGRFEGEEMPGHSVPLIGIGGMILITGFLAFNGGSLGTMTTPGAGAEISIVCANTVMAGAGGALMGLIFFRLGVVKPRCWNFSMTLNAAFSGMVCVCASADSVKLWGALVMGITGGLVYFGLHFLILHCKIDDPLDATSVHFGGGLWGVLAGPIFKANGILYGPNKENLMVRSDAALLQTIFTWSLGTATLMFGLLKYFGLLRVTAEEEIRGLDLTKHNEPAYPKEGWPQNTNRYKVDGNCIKTSRPKADYTNEIFQMEHM
ncbi:hypothetical protein RUM43_005752 [Polyplax serrata]|uniref:Ammonium transporter AmtB-like domain-containing protein n=1 Tax=Polyplax serrata TaxID=468196 RepID=A0AAN8PDY8_POLSC